jgi:hypothetical protein
MGFAKWVLFILIIALIVGGGLIYFKLQGSPEVKDAVIIQTTNKTVSDCNAISTTPEKEACYFEIAKTSKDASLCRLITDVRLRGDCYLLTG